MIGLWLIGIILLIYAYIHFNKQSRLIDKMFPGPYRLPIVGTLPVKMFDPKNLAKIGQSLMKDYGHKPFRVWYLNKPYIIISDAKTAKIILSQTKYSDKAEFYEALEPWFGRNHFTGKGAQWLRFRKHDVNGFRTNALNSYLPVFDKNCRILCQILQNVVGKNPVVNLYRYIHMYSLDNLSGTVFGYDLDTQANPDSPYYYAIDQMIQVYFWSIILKILKIRWAFYFTSWYRFGKKAGKTLREFSKVIVDNKRDPEFLKKHKFVDHIDDDDDDDSNNNNNCESEDEKGPLKDVVFTQVLSKKFTDEEIGIEIEMAISAGHGTITSTLGFIFYMLAKYPDIQQKVYEEIMSVYGDSDCSTMEKLAEMQYTDQVIKETLRIFSVAPVIGRHVNEDVYLNENQFIPKNTDVIIALTLIHKDPSIWPNPHIFDPDRFSPENVKNRDPYAFVAWSGGPRGCLGYRYTMIELKLTLAHLIRKFKFSLTGNPDDKIKLKMTLLLTSANGFTLKLEERNEEQISVKSD